MCGRDGRPVVGIDGSDHALTAVRWAAGEAARRGGQLRPVTAHPRCARPRNGGPGAT